MNVNIFNLEKDHKEIKDKLLKAFEEVLTRGDFILGKEVVALEEAFAKYIGVRYAIGVGNGTDALRIGGLSLDIKAGRYIRHNAQQLYCLRNGAFYTGLCASLLRHRA